MVNNIFILSEDNNYLVIGWQHISIANHYTLVGMTDNFVYEKICDINDNFIKLNKNDIKKYIKLKVDYILDDKNLNKQIVLDSTNEFEISDKLYSNIDIKCIKSYNGLTLSFINELLFDKYYLYEKINNKYILISESEDFQISSKNFKENKIYYVEAFNKNDEIGTYELVAKSNDYKCQIEDRTISNKPRLSVIIPIFNAMYFISRTIDSILLSTMNDIEIILVDDGSKDNSLKILNWYAKQYKDIIKVFHQDNKGVSYARAQGLELVKGTYSAFSDSDDLIHPYMYEKLYNAIKKEKTDIAIGKTYQILDHNSKSIIIDINSDKEYLVYDYENMLKNIYFASCCNKIVKTSILKKYKMSLLDYYEDIGYTAMLYSYIDKFIFVPTAYYFWDRRLRKTIGTITDYGYAQEKDKYKLHVEYINSTYYAFYNGNQKKEEILEYDSVNKIYYYLKQNNILESTNEIPLLYINSIINANKKYSLLKNKYIIENKELYDYIKKILKKQNN